MPKYPGGTPRRPHRGLAGCGGRAPGDSAARGTRGASLSGLVHHPDLGEFGQTLFGELDPQPGLLGAAKGHVGAEIQMLVDPDRTAFDPLGDLTRQIAILAPSQHPAAISAWTGPSMSSTPSAEASPASSPSS